MYCPASLGAAGMTHAVSCGGADYMRGPGHLIVVSDVLIFCMLAFLAAWSWVVGFGTVWRVYFVPWLVRLCSSSNLSAHMLSFSCMLQWAHNWWVWA